MDSNNDQVQLRTKKTTLAVFARTLQREAHVLKDRPDLLWQQLFNRLKWEPEPLLPNSTPRCGRMHC